MADTHLNAKFLMDMFCQVLGRIDTAVLTTRTAEREHQRRKATLDISTYVCISQFVDIIEKREYLTVVL